MPHLPAPRAPAPAPRVSPRLSLVGAWCALVLSGQVVGGCSCEEERPYTPFGVASGQPSASSAPTAPRAPTTPSPRVVQAPADTTSWPVFSRELTAPSGAKFHWATLYGDPSASDARVLSWTLGPPAAGGLWLHGADGRPTRHLLRSPSFLPRGGDCRETARFLPGEGLTGTLDVRRSCSARLLPGSPERALVLLDLGRPEPFVFGLRILATPEGESFEFEAESVDLDGDGQTDVVAHFRARALREDAQAEESLALHWLSRPAGPSRRKDTPSREFDARARALVLAGQRKAERRAVPGAVDSLRRLYAALCAESATPRVLDWDGAPLPCGGMDDGLKQLVTAAVHAELGLERPGRALGEVTRADWFGSAPPTEAQRTALEKLVLRRVPSGPARRLAELRASLSPAPSGPSVPRLRFDADHQLWALGPERRVVSLWPPVDPDAPDATDEQAPAAWELEAVGPAGQRVLAVLPSCERPELQLGVSDAAAGVTLGLGVLAPRPGRCREAFGGGPLPARLLGWFDGGPRVAVAGQVMGPANSSEPSGTTTALGWLELASDGASLWRDDALRGERECVTSRDRSYLACVVDSSVVVWQRPEKVAVVP